MFIKTIGDALINSDFVRRYDMGDKICPNCGEPFPSLNPRRKYCCKCCADTFNKRIKPRTISNAFAVFKNITKHSANYDQFKQLWLLCGFKEVSK